MTAEAASGARITPVLEEEVNDGIAAVLVLKEHKKRPVHEPDALLELLQDGRKGVGVNDLLQLGQVIQRRLPLLH